MDATRQPTRQPRDWGPWTQHKLTILDEYLQAFARASTKSVHRVYLDAFAGEGMGIDRITGEQFDGSARRALAVAPPFTHLRYFELGARAARLDNQLRVSHPSRDIRVYAGDCNTTIPQALRDLDPVRQAASFAFLDPDGMELAWDTVTAIADHKRGLSSKVEQWMLFPSSGIVRTLTFQRELTPDDCARTSRLYGSNEWEVIYELRREGLWEPQQALDGYVDLLRWRLEQDLGYRTTLALEIKNIIGVVLYHMVFATDHPAGQKIMTDCYQRAVGRAPALRNHLRSEKRRRAAEARGEYNLFGGAMPLDPTDYAGAIPDRMLAGRPPPPPPRRAHPGRPSSL